MTISIRISMGTSTRTVVHSMWERRPVISRVISTSTGNRDLYEQLDKFEIRGEFHKLTARFTFMNLTVNLTYIIYYKLYFKDILIL